MRAFGDEDHVARLARVIVCGADAQQAAKLAMRARLGRHGNCGHSGERDQPFGQLVHSLERTAHGRWRLERVDIGKAGQPCKLFVEARIVLHRARTERERAKVDAVIEPREPRIVPHCLGLGQAGQIGRGLAQEGTERSYRPDIGLVHIDAALIDSADFEAQRFFEQQAAVTA